jgi:hypothetical protein
VQEEKGERGLVDIPPVRMFAAGQVVKFVPVQSPSVDKYQLDQKLHKSRDKENEYPGRCRRHAQSTQGRPIVVIDHLLDFVTVVYNSRKTSSHDKASIAE